MGSIGGMLGTAGGALGTGVSGPQQANIQQGTNAGQVQQAQTNANQSLAQQQALLRALQGQNGFGQQNAVAGQQQALASALAGANGVGNQSGAMTQQQALNAQLAAANGVGTQQSAISGLQGLAAQQAATEQQYQNIAQGRGPNPALAALNQATGQNVANQAALMAGQRGAGANVGLLARQAAQQGAATQQQAVGQAATTQAQQQLGALSGLTAQQQALGQTQQAIGGLGTTQVGQQQAGISSQAQQAAQQVAEQQAQQQALANQANIIAGQQIAGTGGLTQAELANLGQAQGALGAQNQAYVGSQGSINAGNTQLANTQLGGQQKIVGGVGQAAGTLLNTLAEGGEVKKYADGTPNAPVGGTVAPAPIVPVATPSPVVTPQSAQQGPQSSFGQFLNKAKAGIAQAANANDQSNPNAKDPNDALEQGSKDLAAGLGHALKGITDSPPLGAALVGGPDLSSQSNNTAMAAKGGLASGGGHVKARKPSQKAEKSGDSYSNDKVPAMLSEGEIVVPRSVTMSKDPVAASADFVAKVLAKRKAK